MNGIKLERLSSLASNASWSKLMLWMLAVGFFIQLSGKVWLVSGSARNTQVYIWLLLPALLLSLHKLILKRDFRLDLQYLPWALFLGWVALSTLWATAGESSALSLAKRGVFVGLYLLAIHMLLNRHEDLFRRVLLVSLVVVAFGALASLIYQYGVLDKPKAFRAYRIDRMGIGDLVNYGWPVAAGIFNGAVATWVIGVVLERRSDRRSFLFWLMLFFVLAAYVFMTGTRGACFALMGSCILAVLMHRSKRGLWGICLCILLTLGAGIILWDQIIEEVSKRQLSGRGPIWDYYFQVMSGHWLFGHGLGTPFTYLWPDGKMISPHAHSLFLQQVYDSGLVSLFLMVIGLMGLCYRAWTLRDNPWIRLAFPALLFAIIAMLTDVERIYTRPGDYWTVFWLPVAILLAVSNKKPHAH
ncbi:O-antigen ligase family protein [Pseudomonas urmiensis]|uniref:O-antigen ligase family protein n=1 Tax=Pseudomonas urmiensis TaxID=2745493 RepID=A0A923FXS5_9PSED|nr:O-antigen ligase family protein [Pseudomonas urmiensis]MBV4537357.1 O-antigen ligase family protein [Pseudomonas urmiensis]